MKHAALDSAMVMRKRPAYRHGSSAFVAVLALSLVVVCATAAAQDPESNTTPDQGAAAEPDIPAQESASLNIDIEAGELPPDETENDDSGGFLMAGKVGGILPFTDLGLMVSGAVELGYVFGGTKRQIGALLDVSYTAPTADGEAEDSRLAAPGSGGAYSWELTQKQLTLQPTFLFRLTGLVDWLTPYAGIGPRIYFLESVIEGQAGDSAFPENTEQSTRIGFAIPLGAEFRLGPGGLLAELLFQWAPLPHDITGDSNLGGASLLLGYRAIL